MYRVSVCRIKEKRKEQGEGEAGIKRAEHQRIPMGMKESMNPSRIL